MHGARVVCVRACACSKGRAMIISMFEASLVLYLVPIISRTLMICAWTLHFL